MNIVACAALPPPRPRNIWSCLSAVVVPVMVNGHSYWMQLELGRGSNNVEAGLTLDAYRLQRK